eukprot:TRINITY_DN87571_c0_g1_i2.p1 TRINITY_DN87571_c0_g1~~TRINITY_DN87571_c0_g1_i2.p1  ORF type:complete len:144 (+),score=17.07 TRINITY_DN87571_c0_g1_i2:51-434(+)
MATSTVVYSLHTGLELLAGSLLVIYGKGSLELGSTPTPRAKLYRRWHGAGLLALAALGGLVLARGQTKSEAGKTVAVALAGFHATAFGVHVLAATEPGDGKEPPVALKEALLSPHWPLALGFIAIVA